MPGSGGTLSPAGQLSGVRELLTPGVVKTKVAALRRVEPPTGLASAVTCADDVRAGTSPPRPPTLRVPLTELLGRGSLLLLPLAAAEPPTLHRSTAATTTSTAPTTPTTTNPWADTSPSTTRATTTPATTPAHPTPSTAAAPSSTATTPAPLAPAALASPTRSSRSPDALSSEVADSSSICNGGEERGGGAPLREGGAGVTTRGTYSYNALLSC
ncbi:unnamed protein product [Closterium sp. NIES-53]